MNTQDLLASRYQILSQIRLRYRYLMYGLIWTEQTFMPPNFISLTLSTFISLLVLSYESIYAERLRNIIREFLFDTALEIDLNKRVYITQKLVFLPPKESSFLLDQTELNSQYMNLLTQEERLWLNQQIQQFLSQARLHRR